MSEKGSGQSLEDRALRAERRAEQILADAEAKGGAAQEPPSHGGDLPPGIAGITARWSYEGSALLQDARSGFSIVVPGKPAFFEPGYVDATWAIPDVSIIVQVRVTPAPAGVPLADAVMNMARNLTKAAPEAAVPPAGARAAARGQVREPTRLRLCDVLGGGSDSIAVVVFNYKPEEVDPITVDTVRSAVVGSAQFRTTPLTHVTEVIPPSRWFAPGLPLRLRADRPAVPAGASAAADVLLQRVGLLPPETEVEGALRGELEQILAGAVGAADARTLADSLTFVHDVRGLVFAIRASR